MKKITGSSIEKQKTRGLNLDDHLHVKMTSGLKQSIERAAQEMGLDVSSFVRMVMTQQTQQHQQPNNNHDNSGSSKENLVLNQVEQVT